MANATVDANATITALNDSVQNLTQLLSADEYLISPPENQHALANLIHTLTLLVVLYVAHLLRRHHVRWLGPSAAALLLGMAAGAAVQYSVAHARWRQLVHFDADTFFLLVLPPIIFMAGIQLHGRAFLWNLLEIVALAFAGVIINTAVFAGLLYAVIRAGVTSATLSLLECLLIGAIISATDPVSVLSTFEHLKVDLNLYSMVFGESVLNDAVAIVLYRALIKFESHSVTVSTCFGALGQFSYIFGGSMAIGTAVGAFMSLLLKYSDFEKTVRHELAVIALLAYSSYLIADALQLSGIVSVLCCGVMFSAYAADNLQGSEQATVNVFDMASFVAEMFAFTELGLGVFDSTRVTWNASLCGWSLLFIFVARAAAVFPLLSFTNLFRRRSRRVSLRFQTMIWHAGLRGALAYALAQATISPHRALVATTVDAIVLFTLIVVGGSTEFVLWLLRIPVGVEADMLSMQSRFIATIERIDMHVRKLLTGMLFNRAPEEATAVIIPRRTVSALEMAELRRRSLDLPRTPDRTSAGAHHQRSLSLQVTSMSRRPDSPDNGPFAPDTVFLTVPVSPRRKSTAATLEGSVVGPSLLAAPSANPPAPLLPAADQFPIPPLANPSLANPPADTPRSGDGGGDEAVRRTVSVTPPSVIVLDTPPSRPLSAAPTPVPVHIPVPAHAHAHAHAAVAAIGGGRDTAVGDGVGAAGDEGSMLMRHVSGSPPPLTPPQQQQVVVMSAADEQATRRRKEKKAKKEKRDRTAAAPPPAAAASTLAEPRTSVAAAAASVSSSSAGGGSGAVAVVAPRPHRIDRTAVTLEALSAADPPRVRRHRSLDRLPSAAPPPTHSHTVPHIRIDNVG